MYFRSAQEKEDYLQVKAIKRLLGRKASNLLIFYDFLRTSCGRGGFKNFQELKKDVGIEKKSDERLKEIFSDIQTALSYLKPLERSVVLLYFFWGLTLIEIGFLFNKGEPWASIHCQKGVDIIKRHL